jgi:NAD(P)-dependent dehydrogenase (short-subunit alcohol dehydrogenase family)
MAVALVTGAGSPTGIGRAVALRLARDGHDVACVDIAVGGVGIATSEDLEAVAAEIRSMGRRALALSADVADEVRVEEVVDQATKELGPIELVANVAGGPLGSVGPLISVEPDQFRRTLDVNLVGTWLVSRACANRMMADGRGGRICNTSSQASKVGFEMMGAYSASKAGINLLTQVMAKELGPSGISVNAVCPGSVDTDATRRFAEQYLEDADQAEEYVKRQIPLRRLQTADEIASAIAWLLSDDASGVTGESLNVTGGETMV